MNCEKDKNKNIDSGYGNISLFEFLLTKYIKKYFYLFFVNWLYSSDENNTIKNYNELSNRDRYISNLSFSDWFSIYGVSGKKKIIRAINCFILLNIITILFVSVSAVSTNSYRLANAFLRPADFINKFYILPISKIGGYKNICTIPFYVLRDFLYENGLAKLNNNEGKKFEWWYRVRFLEYASLVNTELFDIFLKKEKITKKQIRMFDAWNKEVYNEAKRLNEIDLSNTIYKNDILFIFRDLIKYYGDSASSLRHIKFFDKYKRYDKNKFYERIDNDTVYTMELWQDFERLKNYLKNENTESYKKYIKTSILEEYIIQRETTNDLISYEQKVEKINCNADYVILFHESGLKILDYIVNNFDSMTSEQEHRSNIAMFFTHQLYIYCPMLKDEYLNAEKTYQNFIVPKRKEFSKK